jgi:hypothetical protein
MVSGLQLNAINYAPIDADSTNVNKMNVAQLKNDRLNNNNNNNNNDKKDDKMDDSSTKKPKALQEKADKTFYLGYDFMGRNNPSFHHEEFYSYDAVKTPRSTPMINNISLVVSTRNSENLVIYKI